MCNNLSCVRTDTASKNDKMKGMKPEEISTDVLLEGLTFLVMRLKPRQICANVAFLLRFSPDSVIKGELGYCLTTFAVVLQGLLQKSLSEEEASIEHDWIIFQRGKHRITEAEGRRLLAEFLEDCVVVSDTGDSDEAVAAAARAAASPRKPAPKDDIDKEWVLMG